MTDEKLITEFLDKNYEVKTDKLDYVFIDKVDNKKYDTTRFKNHFLTIFGAYDVDDTNSSTSIMFGWFSLRKRIINKKLFDAIDTLNTEVRSQFQLKELIEKCKNNYGDEYHEDFIKNVFLEHYKETYFKSKLDEYIEKFNTDLGSIRLIEDYQDEFILEHHEIITYAKNYLNRWYSETVIGDKVKDLLSQLVITLGPRNWVVTWIGHGQLSKANLLKNFMNESSVHHQFIIDMYDKWYDKAIMEASEWVMNNPEPNWRLTNN